MEMRYITQWYILSKIDVINFCYVVEQRSDFYLKKFLNTKFMNCFCVHNIRKTVLGKGLIKHKYQKEVRTKMV